jgi:hypothetical protein
MELDRPRHDLPAASVLAHYFSSAIFFFLYFAEKFGVRFQYDFFLLFKNLAKS